MIRMFFWAFAALLLGSTALLPIVFSAQAVAGVYTAALSPAKPNAEDRAETSPTLEPTQATQLVPGVVDHKLTRTGNPAKPDININYPSIGMPAVDKDIRRWATSIADVFSEYLDQTEAFGATDVRDERPPYELLASYSVSRPSDAAISITFEVWTYTGGAHGNLDIITLNYSLLTGQRLTLLDLFENSDEAIKLMAQWSYTELARRFSGSLREEMLKNGTQPVPENFAALTLTPTGITVCFQPYQVAPWAAGAQKVAMPLEELAQAKPLLRIWGR